jgi:hypothetical protein
VPPETPLPTGEGVGTEAPTALATDDQPERTVPVLLFDASSSGRPPVTPASAGLLDAKSEDQRLMA